MDAKHTPGPWRVEEGTSMVWGACNADDLTTYGMGYPITDCRITPSNSWARGPDYDSGIANATLIAAAPELLNALDELLAMCERQADFNDDGDGMIFNRARAAIRAAKGE